MGCEARPGPLLCLRSNYLIDNKVGITSMPWALEQTEQWGIAVTQTMVDRVECASICGPREARRRHGLWRGHGSQWLVDRNIAPCRFADKSATPRWHIQPCRTSSSTRIAIFMFAQASGTDQYRQYRPRPHRLLQGQQERLFALLIETEVHDGGRAQNHPRPQRRCTRSRPCIGQYGSLPAVAP